MHDPNDCNEEVVEFTVVQRLLFRKSIRRACANCLATDVKLKTCERCYDALYCKRYVFSIHFSNYGMNCLGVAFHSKLIQKTQS